MIQGWTVGLSRQNVLGTRERRVGILLVSIIVLSAADLLLTIAHLQTIGMIEANPIAAFLIRTTSSAWILSAYKLCTVAVCVSLLFRLRRHRSSEIAGWVALAVLGAMAVQWHFYSASLDSPEMLALARSHYPDAWLCIGID